MTWLRPAERRRVRRLVRIARTHRGELGRWRRIDALRVLARAGHPETLLLLLRALYSGDRDVAGAAVAILGTIRNVRAAQLLVQALRTSAYTPSRIASVLDQFPLPILDLVRSLLRAPDPTVRFWGATLLARYREAPGIDHELADLAADGDPRVRKAAVETLGSLHGLVARGTAVRLLDDPVFFVRVHAIRALGQLGHRHLVALVAPALADPQWWVRQAAKHALQAAGPNVSPELAPYLDHPDGFARNGAAEVLQNLGVLDRWAVEAAAGPAAQPTVELLRKASLAGGAGMMEAVLQRAEPTALPELSALFERWRLERGPGR